MPSKSPLRRVHPRKRPCWRRAVTSAMGHNRTIRATLAPSPQQREDALRRSRREEFDKVIDDLIGRFLL
jgi:hypothetical protein